MTEQEVQIFKELFGKYCQQEMDEGHCETCEGCLVNNAYMEIFDKYANCEDDADE